MLYGRINEHFGIGICEGFKHSIPSIATNTGGPVEIIQHNVNGFLSDTSAEAFAKYMKIFVENPDLAHKMGKAGHDDLKRKYWTKQIEKVKSILS